jgi:hypothetical protein
MNSHQGVQVPIFKTDTFMLTHPAGWAIGFPSRAWCSRRNTYHMKSTKMESIIGEGLFPWTYRDLANSCRVSLRTVHEWRAAGMVPYLKAGGLVRFNPEAVRSALEGYVIKHR